MRVRLVLFTKSNWLKRATCMFLIELKEASSALTENLIIHHIQHKYSKEVLMSKFLTVLHTGSHSNT